jgi:hypothetical protein
VRNANIHLTVQAATALAFWLNIASKKVTFKKKLFEFPDGTYDLRDGETCLNPYSIPSGALVITTDASSSGFAAVRGSTLKPDALYCGIWSPVQSLLSSNFKECKTIELALKAFFTECEENSFYSGQTISVPVI